MSSSSHQIRIKAVDQTAGAFESVKKNAKSTGEQIQKLVSGAIMAVGAYAGFDAFKKGVNELRHLSDVATRTSTSVDELTRAATAMGVLGINNMGVDELATAFEMLQKNTGRTGMSGFLDTIREIGKVEDIATRSKMAVEMFGRSGLAFIPLINAANTSTEALENVINAMPGIPQSAANAGDDAADAMLIAGEGIHSIWLQTIGAICSMFSENFVGGIRGAAAAAAAWMEYFAKVATVAWKTVPVKLKSYVESASGAVGSFISAPFQGKNPLKEAKDSWNYWQDFREEKIEKILEPTNKWAEQLATKLMTIEKFALSVEKAAVPTRGRVILDKVNPSISTQTPDSMTIDQREPRVNNEMILGGSNMSRILASRGPETQQQLSKAVKLLEKVADNTEKTSENTKLDGETFKVF